LFAVCLLPTLTDVLCLQRKPRRARVELDLDLEVAKLSDDDDDDDDELAPAFK